MTVYMKTMCYEKVFKQVNSLRLQMIQQNCLLFLVHVILTPSTVAATNYCNFHNRTSEMVQSNNSLYIVKFIFKLNGCVMQKCLAILNVH